MPIESLDLDSSCGRYFTYRDFVECSDTWQRLTAAGDPKVGVLNLPRERATLEGIELLCTRLLDPVCARFGRVVLTYGFSSPAFAKRIPSGIAPGLDQHAGAERLRSGRLACARGGQSADIAAAPDVMAEIVHFAATELPFDRLYYYGPGRPVHLSIGPATLRQVTVLRTSAAGRRLPRRGSVEEFALGRLSVERCPPSGPAPPSTSDP